jgi:FYVE, RhoGEF and PH domain containing 5/6
MMHRESVISVASFDSLPEEGPGEGPVAPGIRNGLHGHVPPKRLGPGKSRLESPRRRTRRDVPKPVDDIREAKRRKVIEEFYDTEKAYVDGLELIYSVSYFHCFWSSNFCAHYQGSTS